jgi:hypothetical protein
MVQQVVKGSSWVYFEAYSIGTEGAFGPFPSIGFVGFIVELLSIL